MKRYRDYGNSNKKTFNWGGSLTVSGVQFIVSMVGLMADVGGCGAGYILVYRPQEVD